MSEAIGAIHAEMAGLYEERVRQAHIVGALNERDPAVLAVYPAR